MRKKGQAALEFLMTYGWAILAAVIVVGVLWYMIGNPANLAGDDFQMSVPFVAEAMSMNSNGDVSLEVRNGGGNNVNITGISIDSDTGSCASISPNNEYAPGNTSIHTISCSGLSSGERLSGTVLINYTEAGTTLDQSATGTIRGVIP